MLGGTFNPLPGLARRLGHWAERLVSANHTHGIYHKDAFAGQIQQRIRATLELNNNQLAALSWPRRLAWRAAVWRDFRRARQTDLFPIVNYIQYGCGHRAPETWTNFDSSPTIVLERLPLAGRFIEKRGPLSGQRPAGRHRAWSRPSHPEPLLAYIARIRLNTSRSMISGPLCAIRCPY